MQLEEITCYLCNSQESTLWAQESGYNMMKCSGCGLVYLNPRPKLETIDESSKTGMHRSEKGSINRIGMYSSKKVVDYGKKIADLFPKDELKSQEVTWLDIGSGYGEFIQALQNQTKDDAEILGIEPCRPKTKKAQSLGLPISSKTLSALKGGYTHISLINVFSHLPDPVEFILELKAILAPRGELILVTGNGGDIQRKDFPGSLYLPDHLSFAGEENLQLILKKSGFNIKLINRYQDGGSIDNVFISLLKNVARWSLGRPIVPLWVSTTSKFRSLWIRAELRQ